MTDVQYPNFEDRHFSNKKDFQGHLNNEDHSSTAKQTKSDPNPCGNLREIQLDMPPLPEIDKEEREVLFRLMDWTLRELFRKNWRAIFQRVLKKAEQLPLRILAMDCEFIRTLHRNDAVARLSVQDRARDMHWDVLVNHKKEDVCDVLPEITGLSLEDVTEGGYSLDYVKSVLHKILNDSKCTVILVGHDIQHDLDALYDPQELKGINFGLIDTSIIHYWKNHKRKTPGLNDVYKIVTEKDMEDERENGVHCSIHDCSAALEVFEFAISKVKRTKQQVALIPTAEVRERWEKCYVFDLSNVHARTKRATLVALFGQFGKVKRVRFLYNHKARQFMHRAELLFDGKVELYPSEVALKLHGVKVDEYTKELAVAISRKSKGYVRCPPTHPHAAFNTNVMTFAPHPQPMSNYNNGYDFLYVEQPYVEQPVWGYNYAGQYYPPPYNPGTGYPNSFPQPFPSLYSNPNPYAFH